MEQRIADLEQRVTAVEKGLADNTAITTAIKGDTGELVSLFKASKFGVAMIKWGATVGGALATAWLAWKRGQ